jgi:ribonucleoside-diphosphate reductase alpha chain
MIMSQNKILGEVAFATQYAHIKADGTRETYIDAMTRVKNMHQKKFPYLANRIEDVFKTFVYHGIVFPSQRSTQFAGVAIERNNMRMYNCTASYIDRVRFFAEGFWLLMSGCGVGFSVQKHHIAKLPNLISKTQRDARLKKIHVVEDSIEGWAEAVHVLTKSYLPTNEDEARYCIGFHYDQVRPEGASISIGGVAPGPKVLEVAIEKVRFILDQAVDQAQDKLRPIQCFDIFMHISHAALLSSRRAATIALFSPDDEEMMTAKTGTWWQDNPQRAYANISAQIVLDGLEKKDTFIKIIENAKQFGEPGFFFASDKDFATNPCGEIGLYPTYKNEDGSTESGWAVCNLNEIVVAKIKDAAELKAACRAAAFLGTLQASYTNTGYLGDTTKKIIERDALLGVSMTGIMSAPDLIFDEFLLKGCAQVVIDENEQTSRKIGINSALRATTIKPSGNSSTVAGCSAGIHPYHAKKYIRTMRINKINPIWQEIVSQLPEVCDDRDPQVGIVSFACEAPAGAIVRKDLSASDFLKKVEFIQRYWVAPTTKLREKDQFGLTHNVSNTCTVKADEWDDLINRIWKLRDNVKGISLLSDYGDHVYENAPYQTVEDDNIQMIEKYNKLLNADWSKVNLNVGGFKENPAVEPACAGGVCLI